MRYSNSSAVTTGRFASQMLGSFGVQRTVRTVQGVVANAFKYLSGGAPAGVSTYSSFVGTNMEVGYCDPDTYDQSRCYYIDRGASSLYADTMAMLSIDMSRMLGITTVNLLEQSELSGKMNFSDEAYNAMNKLRDPGNQLAITTAVNNRRSLQARQIQA